MRIWHILFALLVVGLAGLPVMIAGWLGPYAAQSAQAALVALASLAAAHIMSWRPRQDLVAKLKADLKARIGRFVRRLAEAHEEYTQERSGISQDLANRGLYNTTGHATAVARAFLAYVRRVEEVWFALVEDRADHIAALSGKANEAALGVGLSTEYLEAAKRKESRLHQDFSATDQLLSDAIGQFARPFHAAVARERPELAT